MPKPKKKVYKSTVAFRQREKEEGAWTYYYNCLNCGCGDIQEEHKYCPACGLKIRRKDK